MKLALILCAVAAALPSQDSKPAKKDKPESAPATRPHDAKVLNRKVTLSLPGDWTETDTRSTFALDGWEHGKSWKHPTIPKFTIHLYGAQGPGLTPAALAKKWLDSAGGVKIDRKVEVTGRSRQMKGLDVEVELDENGSPSFYWMRAVGGAQDRVFVLLSDTSPVDYGWLEQIVLATGPIFDSFLDPGRKDPWRRDPDVTVTGSNVSMRITVPAGWKYTRLAPEGSLIWMGPENMQEFILALPQLSSHPARAFGPFGPLPSSTAEQTFEATVKIAELLRITGRLVSKGTVPGADRMEEVVTVARGNVRRGEPALWQRRRVILHDKTVVSLLAKHPLKDYDSLPAEAVQKQVTAVFDSLKFEVAAK
jgi:hypothetical protein